MTNLLILNLILSSLAFKHENNAFNNFPLEATVFIRNFDIKNLEGFLDRIKELRRCLVCVVEKVDQHFLYFDVLSFDKSLQKVVDPYIRMVLGVGPDQFVKIFSHNKSLISNSFYYTGHNNDIYLFPCVKIRICLFFKNDVIFLLSVSTDRLSVCKLFHRIEDNLNNFLRDGEKFDAFIHEILFQKRGEHFNLL